MRSRTSWTGGHVGWPVLVCALAGCAAEPKVSVRSDEARGGWDGNRGGWDGNRGGWDGNRGGWDGNSGSFGDDPGAWAPEGTGPGTLSNLTLLGLELRPTDAVASPCGALSPIAAARVRSSRVDAGLLVGPDVELVATDGARRWLGAGETVTVRARTFNGYLQWVDATLRITRVATYQHPHHPDAIWPAFQLEACKDADPDGGYRSLGVVSFIRFFTLPEQPGQAVQYPPGLVQPVSVPYSTQPAALPLKFAAGAGLPVALADEPSLDVVGCSTGRRVANHEVILAGALALGNASWVHFPDDPDHRFLAFFTRNGNPVALFAEVTRADGTSPEPACLSAELGLPPDRRALAPLQLTDIERDDRNADRLDAIHTGTTLVLPVGDRAVSNPTHFGSGRSTYRRDTYLETSQHPARDEFVAQLVANIAATRLGWHGGAVYSQTQLGWLFPGRGAFVVAAQSPVPEDFDFDPPPPPGVCGNGACERDETCGSCPADCPVCDHPPPWEQTPMADAGVPDAGVPDAPPPDAPWWGDAAMPDAPPPDAAPSWDAGVTDAPPPDSGSGSYDGGYYY